MITIIILIIIGRCFFHLRGMSAWERSKAAGFTSIINNCGSNRYFFKRINEILIKYLICINFLFLRNDNNWNGTVMQVSNGEIISNDDDDEDADDDDDDDNDGIYCRNFCVYVLLNN